MQCLNKLTKLFFCSLIYLDYYGELDALLMLQSMSFADPLNNCRATSVVSAINFFPLDLFDYLLSHFVKRWRTLYNRVKVHQSMSVSPLCRADGDPPRSPVRTSAED